MGFLHLWKRACEVKHFKVHQDSFLSPAVSITGHKESDLQESVNLSGKQFQQKLSIQTFGMRGNYLIAPFRDFSLPSFNL